MYKITLLRTGETVEYNTREEAEFFVKVAVMATNERIARGLETGKRDSKKNYIITEA